MNSNKRDIYVGGINKSEYDRLHSSLRRKNGKASMCEHCGTVEERRFEWALRKGHSYSDNKEDYLQLCKSCHSKYDCTELTREKFRKRFTEDNPMKNPEARNKVADFMRTRVISNETKQKLSKLNTGKKMSEAAKKKISKATTGGKNPFASHLVDTLTGAKYGTIVEASKVVNVHHNRLSKMIRNIIPNETNLVYANRL